MKTSLITLGFLALVLVGCGLPDADFSTSIPVVESKSQDKQQAGNHVALYTIRCYTNGRQFYQVRIIMHENFAQVNQHLYFSNGTNMYAGPMEIETNTDRKMKP